MKHYLVKKARDFPYQVVSRFKNLNPENAIALFCDPRGGSTWLAETFKCIPDSMIIDEPVHLNNIKQFKKLGFSWRQYIPEEQKWNEIRTIFQNILKGKILNSGLCRRDTVSEVIPATQLILKIIRGKALLPWYVNQFDFKYKPLLVVRHPFALAASQLNHGAWNYKFQQFEIPDGPFSEFYTEHADFLCSLESKEEQLTALWCMTNNVVLHHPKNNESWITMNYENLVLEPQKYFQTIFDRWQIPIPEGLKDRILMPSSTMVGNKKIDPQQLLSDWKNKLSTAQIKRLQKVLDYFKVDYYDENVMPIIPANEVHLKKEST
jgi:hypothetical protein